MRPRGFILVLTLWALVLLTLAVGYFAERVARSVSIARDRQEATQQMVDFESTRADVLFHLATTYLDAGALKTAPPLVLDDRPYRGRAGDIVRVQDNRGLVNVNIVERALVAGLLGNLGVPVGRRERLLDTLQDYTDEDELKRLNGAEAPEYSARGLPPPPNTFLASPHQVRQILGWREENALWEKERLGRFLAAGRTIGLNPNTAPLEVLASIPGVTAQTAAALIARRQSKPLIALGDLPGYAPGFIEDESFLFLPARTFRVTQQGRKAPWAQEFAVTLTPSASDAPWRIEYSTRTAVSYAVENEAEIPTLPPFLAGGGRPAETP